MKSIFKQKYTKSCQIFIIHAHGFVQKWRMSFSVDLFFTLLMFYKYLGNFLKSMVNCYDVLIENTMQKIAKKILTCYDSKMK